MYVMLWSSLCLLHLSSLCSLPQYRHSGMPSFVISVQESLPCVYIFFPHNFTVAHNMKDTDCLFQLYSHLFFFFFLLTTTFQSFAVFVYFPQYSFTNFPFCPFFFFSCLLLVSPFFELSSSSSPLLQLAKGEVKEEMLAMPRSLVLLDMNIIRDHPGSQTAF